MTKNLDIFEYHIWEIEFYKKKKIKFVIISSNYEETHNIKLVIK